MSSAIPPTTPQRRSMWFLIGRGLLVGILALLVIAVGGHVIKRFSAAHAARSDVAENLPAAHAGLAERRAAVEELVEPVLGVPQQSATRLRCDFRSMDRGWFAFSYVQECELVAQTLYEVGEATTGELRAALESVDEIAFPGHTSRSDAECPALRHSHGPNRLERRHYPPGSDSSGDRNCRMPSAPTAHLSDDDTYLEPEALDRSRGWVISTQAWPVSSTELGCAFPQILFCMNPLNDPAIP